MLMEMYQQRTLKVYSAKPSPHFFFQLKNNQILNRNRAYIICCFWMFLKRGEDVYGI